MTESGISSFASFFLICWTDFFVIYSGAYMPTLVQGQDLISIADLSKNQIEEILYSALSIKQKGSPLLLQGKILGVCFFEPSTRTRLSFEAAMIRLGGSVIGFSDANSTSIQKGETLYDSMRVVGSYCDGIVIRHPMEGSARLCAEAVDVPVINAGDGANQHPTQTLLDLFTIRELFGKIDGLHIALAGDLKYGRTVHSLAMGLAHYNVRLYFISPPELSLPEEISQKLREAGVKFSYHADLSEVLPKVNVLYMTRVQKERHTTLSQNPFVLTKDSLSKAQDSLKILHPLPRVGEIDSSVDDTPFAAWFQQAANGLFVRQAILSLLLGGGC